MKPEPTPAEKAMIHAVAQQVIADRILTTIAYAQSPLKPDRLITVRIAPKTPAELKWDELRKHYANELPKRQ